MKLVLALTVFPQGAAHSRPMMDICLVTNLVTKLLIHLEPKEGES